MSRAYPLAWPIDFPRAQYPEASRFKPHTISQAVDELNRQLSISGATEVTISSNMAMGTVPKDKGVCVYFKLKNKPYALPCDKWRKIEDNVWALAKYVESTRLQRGWGVGSLERDYRGYSALPEPLNDKMEWTEVLKVKGTESLSALQDAYQAAAKRYHPDHGGTHAEMAIVNRAWQEAKSYQAINPSRPR